MSDEAERDARFDEIYERNFEAVRRYIWWRGPGLADDITAEVFAVAWRRLDDVPANALPWLIAVARTALLNERAPARRVVVGQSRGVRSRVNAGAGRRPSVGLPAR